MRRYAERALLALIPGVALYYLVLGGEYSRFDLQELRRARGLAAAKVDSLRAAVDSLEAWADSLATSTLAVERLARERYGLLRDGERLYRFVPPEAAEPAAGGGVEAGGGEP